MSGAAFIMHEQLAGRTMRVRLARPKDFLVLSALFRVSVEEANRKYGQSYPIMDEEEWGRCNRYLEKQLHNPQHAALIAETTEPVGCIFGQLVDRPFGKPRTFCMASGLWIDPTQRKTGLAMELLSGLAQWAEQRGVHTLEWNALGKDTKWTDRGFPPVYTTHQTTWIAGKMAELAYNLRESHE